MKRNEKGMTLLEILVVLTLFATLSVIATQSIFLTLRGSLKGEAIRKTRENLDYAMAVMERNIRNASLLNVSQCVPSGTTIAKIDYLDQAGVAASFSCIQQSAGPPPTYYIASQSATANLRVTNDDIDITSCSLTCNDGISGGTPPFASISLTAKKASSKAGEGAEVSVTNTIYLRTY